MYGASNCELGTYGMGIKAFLFTCLPFHCHRKINRGKEKNEEGMIKEVRRESRTICSMRSQRQRQHTVAAPNRQHARIDLVFLIYLSIFFSFLQPEI